jgi:hypothetical protein
MLVRKECEKKLEGKALTDQILLAFGERSV